MDDRRKRLRFRAWRRGFREMDLIMGRFADARALTMTEEELAAFEGLLGQPDQDVYAWILGQAPPIEHDTAVLAALRAYDPSGTQPA